MDKYEKLYNEALERFKSFKEKYYTKDTNLDDVIFDKNGEMQKDFNGIFPELAESKDERTRKYLIEELKASKSVGELKFSIPAPTKEECIAYLEKQKENPKSADSIPSDCVSDAKCEDKSPKHSDSDGTDIRDTPAYWKGWDDAMKQKEQKPAEWSEEDEKMLQHMDNIEKIRKFVKELQQDFISIQPKDCSLELIKSYAGYAYLDKVLSFLDTLSEEPDKSLEEAANKFAVFYDQGTCDGIAQDCFIAGAEWKEGQMLKIITKGDNLEEAGAQYVETYFRDIDWTPDVIKSCLEEAFISGGEYVFKQIKYE